MSFEQKRCKFPIELRRCGSYAFNLHQDDIDQGDFCDKHYWEDKFHSAEQDLGTLFEEIRAEQQGNQKLQEECELLRSKFLELNDKIAVAQESLDGKSLCAGKECKMHCGLGHLQGCEAIKAYLKENGGQVD